MLDLAFIQQCAPDVPPITVNAIVKTESSFNPWAIGVNSANRLANQPTSYRQAFSIADGLMRTNASFDLGLAQINSFNLKGLGMTAQQVLDPCTNLQAMQTIFLDCWNRAKKIEANSNKAVTMAFSCYNTGNFKDGFNNGYVIKVLNNHNYVRKASNDNPQIYQTGSTVLRDQPLPKSKLALANYANDSQRKSITSNSSNVASSADEAIDMVNQFSDFQANTNVIQDDQNLVNDKPEKVHHSWDIFQDF